MQEYVEQTAAFVVEIYSMHLFFKFSLVEIEIWRCAIDSLRTGLQTAQQNTPF